MVYSCHQWRIPGQTGSISVRLRIATTRRMSRKANIAMVTDSPPPLQVQLALQKPADSVAVAKGGNDEL
jgi:hypothetical protein